VWDETAAVIEVIWVGAEQENFFLWDSTAAITPNLARRAVDFFTQRHSASRRKTRIQHVGQFTLIRFNKLGCLRKASRRGRPGRESINSEASADVRLDAHYGLKPDIERDPKSEADIELDLRLAKLRFCSLRST